MVYRHTLDFLVLLSRKEVSVTVNLQNLKSLSNRDQETNGPASHQWQVAIKCLQVVLVLEEVRNLAVITTIWSQHTFILTFKLYLNFQQQLGCWLAVLISLSNWKMQTNKPEVQCTRLYKNVQKATLCQSWCVCNVKPRHLSACACMCVKTCELCVCVCVDLCVSVWL